MIDLDPRSPVEKRPASRIDAFSDGVFSIAITLLAFQLLVPSLQTTETAGGLVTALLAQWPAYVAFITSFLTILIIWVNHHRMLEMVAVIDHTLMILNGLLLLGVSVIPFTAHLLDTYLMHPDAPIAAFVYSGWLLVMALTFQGVWYYAVRRGLLHPGIAPGVIASINRAYPVTAGLYALATAMALVSVPVSILITVGLAAFFALPVRPVPIVPAAAPARGIGEDGAG